MAVPVSATSTTTSRATGSNRVETRIVCAPGFPSGIASAAFISRFRNTWTSWFRSPITSGTAP